MNGYSLIEKKYISEVGAEGFLYRHDKTGARVVNLACDDANKCFMISFPTMPEDSTGVAHIIEHSVLGGSEKYPLKDPFNELLKGSMNTFLNAMTAPDFTMYPFASTNEKDFMNILDVYLDAVLHPNIHHTDETFRQEGWHYEISDDGELTVNGIVYNEMRGAMSSPDRVLYQQLLAALFDNCYRHNSGGDPAVIPTLTYEKFCAFHKKHYHPSNAVIYLYGDIDAEKVLTYIDEHFLSAFERQEPVAPIAATAAFAKPVELTDYYPVASEEESVGAALLGEGFVCGGAGDTLTSMALGILSAALFDTEASPVRRALLESGLCSELESDYDATMKQGLLALFVRGAEEKDLGAIEELIDKTLLEVCEAGIDSELLTGCLNVREFSLREEHDGIPRGLLLGLSMAPDAFYNDDCFASVCYDPLLKELREKIGTGYYEELIDRYLLGNRHRAVIRLLPKVGLLQERDAALAARLAEYKASLSDEQIEKIRADAQTLRERQTTPDTPETLALIPLLSLEDIGDGPVRVEAADTDICGLPGLYVDVHSNGICYLNLVFDAGCLDDSDLHYAGLLSDIFGRMSTEKRGFAELSKQALLHTGGLSLTLAARMRAGEPDSCIKTARVSVKMLDSELEAAVALVAEMLTSTDFGDAAHLREIIGALVAQKRATIVQTGHIVAMQRVSAYCTPSGYVSDQMEGLDYAKWLETALARYSEVSGKIIDGLRRVSQKLFCRANLTVCVTGTQSELDAVRGCISVLTDALPEGEKISVVNSFEEKHLNEGIASASDSQYVAQGYCFSRLGWEYSGKLAVLRTLLSTDYLTQQVRIVGGAYGCFAVIRQNTCVFVSYRDPSLAATFDVYASIPEYLRSYDGDEREILKFIIGTLSGMDSPEAPGAAGERAIADRLVGVDADTRARWRDEAVHTTLEDIRGYADMIQSVLDSSCRCVYGGADKIKAEGTMLDSVVTASAEPDKYTF